MQRWKATVLGCLLLSCGTQDMESDLTSSESLRSTRRTGEFEGFEAVNRLIEHRFLAWNAEERPQFQIAEIGGPGILEVRALLGYFDDSSDVSAFRGGGPNPFNAMLWYNQMAVFSRAIADICPELPAKRNWIVVTSRRGEVSYALQPKLVTLLPDLCQWTLPREDMRRRLAELWLQVMSYDAPHAELEAWQAFFLDDGNTFPSAHARVAALFETMLMNPFFILQE